MGSYDLILDKLFNVSPSSNSSSVQQGEDSYFRAFLYSVKDVAYTIT